MKPILICAAVTAGVVFGAGAGALGVPPAKSRLVTSSLFEPVCIASRPGDFSNVFVCGRRGTIVSVNTATGAVGAPAFLDIQADVSFAGDGGLLGLAFDPAYLSNGYFYVFYNEAGDDYRVLKRFHVTPGSLTADAGSGFKVWRYARPIGHNGGWIGFGPPPGNGYLYLSSGDGGTSSSFDAPNRGQTITAMLHAKILRIDVSMDGFPSDADRNYKVPPSNPFVGVVGDDEIWAYGVRNPWRCSFDRATGDLWIADVGQDGWEEIDYEPAGSVGGRNYGWRCMEGNHCTGLGGCAVACGDASLTGPLYEYDHAQGVSITGGYVYRGGAIPAYRGLYVFGDYSLSRIWTFRRSGGGGGTVTEFQERTAELIPAPSENPISNISAFGEDALGELYVSDFNNGVLYKIVPKCRADVNGSGLVTVQDVFDFLGLWFTHGLGSDFNDSGTVTVQDIFDFLAAFFFGCP